MESICNLIEAYDESEGKSSVSDLKNLMKELRKSKVQTTSVLMF
jgi:hypothetical protein